MAIVDNLGYPVVKYTYDAWGNCSVDYDDSGYGIGYINPFTYRGYFFDNGLGLYYLKSRYYDPKTGRFISQDSIEFVDPESINGLNLYAYCGNNPVMYVDYNGNYAVSTILAVVGLIALLMTGAGVIYGTLSEEPVVFDISTTVGFARVGVSIEYDYKNYSIKISPHIGFFIGKSEGLSYSVGRKWANDKSNINKDMVVFLGFGYFAGLEGSFNTGDFSLSSIVGSFSKGASFYIGIDYCFDDILINFK